MGYKILVASDGSDNSRRAVEYAARLVARNRAVKVTVISVARMVTGLESLLAPESLVALAEASVEQARRVAEGARRSLEENGIPAEVVVEKGDPAEIICDLAEKGNYDFIVMGMRGSGGFKGVEAGSVSRRVVKQASCPVTLVR